MIKIRVKNRNGIELAVVLERADSNKLAFVVHGLGGFKEQIHIRTIAGTFKENGYTVVTYDAANTIGESGGRMEEATLTNYFEDLEDVIKWASTQEWYQEPFVVAGHSLGAATSIMYAAEHPNKVKAIAPISALISGDLYESHLDERIKELWHKQGYILEESQSKPGVIKKLGWGLVEDIQQHDMRRLARNIKCSALFVTGSEDKGTPPQDQQQMVDRMHGDVEFHVIEGMEHNPRSDEHNAELKQIFNDWLGRI